MENETYTHVDIPIPQGHFVVNVEQRGDWIRVNYRREKEWAITKMDVQLTKEYPTKP